MGRGGNYSVVMGATEWDVVGITMEISGEWWEFLEGVVGFAVCARSSRLVESCSGVLGDAVECWEFQWSVGRGNGVFGVAVEFWELQCCVGRRSGVLGFAVECWEVQWSVARCSGVL